MVIPAGAVAKISGITIQNGRSGGFTLQDGGAINNQGNLTLSSAVLITNIGSGGGGVSNSGTLLMDNVTLSGNVGGPHGGAGLYNNASGVAEVSNSTFSFNNSQTQGGAIVNFGGTVKILSSTIANNLSNAEGGGIYNDYGSLVLTNVTLAANQGSVAGAISNGQFGTVTANNTTMAMNHATNLTGGITNGHNFTVSNSIIGANYNDSNPAAFTDCQGSITSLGHNVISGIPGTCHVTGVASGDIYGQNPGLAPLASNGGTTQTLALMSVSPALETGDPSTSGTGGTSCAAADQRGLLRPQGMQCDIGAFERSSALSIDAITPKHAGNTGLTEGVISGAGMLTGAGVRLRKSGQSDILGTQIAVQPGNSSIGAVFDLTGQTPGNWDVVVTNTDGITATLPGAFGVDSGGSAQVWAEAVGPSVVRPGTSPVFYVMFGNRGNIDALDVPITLDVPMGIPLEINFSVQPPPPQAGQIATDWSLAPLYVLPGPGSGFVNVPLLVPVIPAGYTGELRFVLAIPGTFTEGSSFTFFASNGDPLLQPGSEPSVVVGPMAAGAVDYARANLGVTIPPAENAALVQYVANQLQNSVANGRAAFSSSSGATALVYSLGQMNIDAALFAASQAVGGTGAALESPLAKLLKPYDTSDRLTCQLADGQIISIRRGDIQPEGSSCTDPKIPIPLPPCVPLQKPTEENPCTPTEPPKPLTPAECRDLPRHHVSADGKTCAPDPKQGCPAVSNAVQGVNPFCTPVPIKASVDPNAKYGPFGPGAQHFHTTRTSFNYSVEFENEPTASLPAQRVLVTDKLDTVNLDLRTFSLGPITFGSYTLTPPAGAQHFSGGLDLRPDQNLIVKVDASLDIATGAVTWRFSTLDPNTEQVTTDPAAGFLPPDTAPPQGEGKLLYSIHPKLNIASGATVCNQATVVFDANAPIDTQNWCNMIDDIAPVSSVTKLPSTQANATFPVQWSGS